jgi:hypothetical protein
VIVCSVSDACRAASATELAAITNRMVGAFGVSVSRAGVGIGLPVPAGASPGSAQCALTTASGLQVRLPTVVNANGTVSCATTQPGVVTLIAGVGAGTVTTPGGAATFSAPLPRTGGGEAALLLGGTFAAAFLIGAGGMYRFFVARQARRTRLSEPQLDRAASRLE